MNKVFFYKCSYEDIKNTPGIVKFIAEKSGFYETVSKNEFTALKIHFGEEGNLSHIPPKALTEFTKKIKQMKAKPFLFETNTLYRGKRTNSIDHINIARQHGFGKLNIPIIIGDGIKGRDEIEVIINQKHFKSAFLASALKDIDNIVYLSHFTGHMLTGFGAAIKNMAMGCASRKGKMKQHCTVSPFINKKFCVLCGKCAQICPVSAIIKEEDGYKIIDEKCIGCSQCISECPQGAVKINWDETYTDLQEKMAEYALAVKKSNPKSFFITFCVYITKECDCMNDEKKSAIPDIGILAGNDPVSIDKAAIDLIIKRSGKDFIKSIYPHIDYLAQINYGEKIGLGSSSYRLIELN